MKQKAKAASTFNPLQHGFVLLPGHRPAGDDVQFYEYRNHDCVDGQADYHRLNLYLSQDGQFVNIWSGVLDSIPLEELFREHGLKREDYDEPRFRGYIESTEQARHILKAVRAEAIVPQTLRADSSGGITCTTIATLRRR